MNTPICDFVKEYKNKNPLRFHMPGHKGASFLGCEMLDITEIDGADSLYEADGIIRESEKNASALFGAHTFYSTEGSSQCIKAMLHLICLVKEKKPLIWAGRNVHKSFLSACVLSDFNVEWLYSNDTSNYLSCKISPEELERKLKNAEEKPDAVYVTSPDYLGNLCDIKALSEVCHRYGVLLLADNAHGAYLKFLFQSLHPIDLGADMCTSSAHKTLPVLTGGAYLHISDNVIDLFEKDVVKTSLCLFGSTSPSYLILQSLDMANKYLSQGYRDRLAGFCKVLEAEKNKLKQKGYTLTEDEALKITVDAKKYGYYGFQLAEILKEKGIYCEFADKDFLVLMATPETGDEAIHLLTDALLNIDKKEEILSPAPEVVKPERIYTPRQASFMPSQTIPVKESTGKILAHSTVGCPPAVPIIVGGEKITEEILNCFNYYNIETCTVVKK